MATEHQDFNKTAEKKDCECTVVKKVAGCCYEGLVNKMKWIAASRHDQNPEGNCGLDL